jgi:flagellar biosynthesis protein FlgN
VPTGSAAPLASLLDKESHLLESFLALLKQEQALLETATAEPLGALAAEKSRLTSELSRLAEAREAEMVRDGIRPGKEGMNAWCRSAAGAASRSTWQHLLALAAEARTLNELNGKLIVQRMQHNQKALAVLMAAANQAATYGPDGQQRAGGGGRSLGSA